MPSYDHNYETICGLKIDGDIPVKKYQSKRTGMKICICEVEGPLVMGYLTIATEAHDDDGLPHTLEHLVFMGSESYPYKGVLDLLANRCLASGTNAFTAVDHTCYTMSTVGAEGFLNLLPIYLDHVLYPTLTDEAFVTEIHHINGEGENAGVVYCEMQACENNGDNLCSLAMYRAIYPGICGYKSETGGLMKNLRESTTNPKIRDYHRTFYRPDNLCVIITGQIGASDVFKAISPIEEKIIQKGPLPDFIRPWQSEVPHLPSPVEQVIPYPCDDCENGMVYVAWRGPLVTEIGECTALILLFQYLSDTSVSPLQRDFVEIEDPYCTDVSTSLNENRETCLNIEFENVPREKLFDIKNRLLQLLNSIAKGDEEFDIIRMSTIIHNKKLDILNELENSPHHTLSNLLICDFLYGSTAKDLEDRLQQVRMIDSLANKNASFWQALIQKYFLQRDAVTIIGEPSAEFKEKMIEEEKNRISGQRECLGPEGLQRKENELQEARRVNEIKPPKDLVTSVSVPSVESIKFHPLMRSCNYSNDIRSDDCLKDLPYCFQLDKIKTKFVSMWVLMDTSNLPLELRLYLPLFTELLMELPVMRNKKLIPYKEIVTELDADTLERATLMGVDAENLFCCGEFPQLTGVKLKVEEEKYEKGIKWLHELLYKTKFTKDRIQVQLTKMINKVSKYKRDGYWILYSLMDSLFYNSSSNSWSCSVLRQHNFLKGVQKLLENNPEEVISNLETLRNKLTDPGNIVVHMASNIQKLGKNPLSCWKSLLESSPKDALSRHVIKKPCEFLKPLQSSVSLSSIAGIGSVESCYLVQSARSIDNCNHPDLPALMVLISYLTQLEGPLWCLIRGQGLAYNFSITISPTDGMIYFILSKCTRLISAYKETKTFIDNLLSGKEEWEKPLLESCRSCLVFETIAERETSVSVVSLQSLLAYYKEIDMNYTRYLLSQIYKVNIEDLKRVGKEYLLPLFDTMQSSCGICCNTSKVEEIVAGFKTMSRDLTVIKDIEDSFLSSL